MSLLFFTTKQTKAITDFGEVVQESLEDLQIFFQNQSKLIEGESANRCLKIHHSKLERITSLVNLKNKNNLDLIQKEITNKTDEAAIIVDQADEIDRNLNKIIGYCVRQYNLAWHKEKLILCLKNESQELNTIIDHLYQKAQLNRTGLAIQNIEKDKVGLTRWMTTLKSQFSTCLSSALKKPPEEGEEIFSVPDDDAIQTTTEKSEPKADVSEHIEKIQTLISQLKQFYLGPKEDNSGGIQKFELTGNQTDKPNKQFIMYLSL